MNEPSNQSTERDLIAKLAHSITKQLIDTGAACQKAHSFAVCTSDTPLRSVYDVYGERVEALLRDKLQER